MNIVAIVQARMGSTRLPKKVMKEIDSIPLIGILLKRLSISEKLSNIIVATSECKSNNQLVKYVSSIGYSVSQGSEDNVLERFYFTAKNNKADIIVRITGDCPLIDSTIVDQTIDLFIQNNVDYASNTNPPTYPDGLDVEVISFSALEDAYQNASKSFDLEHVTPYIRNRKKTKQLNLKNKEDFSKMRWTVDEQEDLDFVRTIFKHFHPNISFSWKDVINFQNKNGSIPVNRDIIRNEGASMGKGQKLYKRAKKIIPGGNMLLSKRPEMFLPNIWPSYFSKSKGCKVWDLDGIEYTDISIMGIGTNILGYGNEEVDEAVKATVQNGNMSTLNCPEEVFLAEKLIEINPWSGMAKFARSGGEANAIAVRIARAFSGKDNIAICGYHGWHDWYLATNLSSDDGLESHLLPGLGTKGVPQGLAGTIFPFNYNDFNQLESIVAKQNIGVIKMEVARSEEPENNFLQKVRELADKHNIVLIFDECTSGFRETFGGIHKKFDIEPDIAMYGKALGNGYGITAIVGKTEIMQAAQDSFISSTFWTERIGPSAAVKTLEVMERIQSWDQISSTGINIKSKWKELSDKHNIDINISGISALPTFSFNSKNHNAYKTLITQEMLKKNFLANTSIYVCTEHTEEIIAEYLHELDVIFTKIQECENGRDINDLLDGPICHSGFTRLN